MIKPYFHSPSAQFFEMRFHPRNVSCSLTYSIVSSQRNGHRAHPNFKVAQNIFLRIISIKYGFCIFIDHATLLMGGDILCCRKSVITFKIVFVSKGYSYAAVHRYVILCVTLSLLSNLPHYGHILIWTNCLQCGTI